MSEKDPVVQDDLSFIGADPTLDEEGEMDRGDLVTTLPESPPEPTPVVEDPPEPEEGDAPVEPAPEPVVEPEVASPPKPKKVFIPKERFDRINERMQRAESALKAIQSERLSLGESPSGFDFDEAEQKYADALVNGNLDTAKLLRADIRHHERVRMEYLASERAVQSQEKVLMKASIDAAVALVNAEYPVFNPDAPEYDQTVVDEALELYSGFLASGKLSAQEALIRSARATAALHKVSAASLADEEAPKAPRGGKPAGTLDQKLKVAESQPPRLSQTGGGHSQSYDLAAMGEREFDKLDETTLRRLRGDFVAS